MTPVATSAAATRTIPRHAGGTMPRRVSGPARRRRPVAQPAPTFWRHIAELADSRLLVRLTRGRAWIAVVGVLLMGLVFVQVSMLRLNTGIGRDVATATQLERSNQQLRNKIADLGATDRFEAAAQRYGMVMPAAGDVHYLRAGRATPAAAARGITTPAPVAQQQQQQATTSTATPTTTSTPTATTATATTATTATASTQTTQQPSVAQQQQTPVTTATAASASGGVAATP